MKKFLFALLTLCLCFSCATKKEVLYFQDSAELNGQEVPSTFEPVIEANDILYISVTSIDEILVKPFTRVSTNESVIGTSNPELKGYLVNAEGNINFPVLGSIPVAGKSRKAIESDLKARLSDYVTDVVVDVRIMNFKVTVLGEVLSPGVFTIKDERVTLPEVLGLAGDLTKEADRNHIKVIREEGDRRIVETIDITQTDFFAGPFYFLKQNDVVYVQPSQKGVKKSGFLPDVPALLSLFTVVLSTVIILTR